MAVLIMLRGGQMTGIVLIGSVGFMVLMRRGQELLAGAVVALVAVKPQLAYLLEAAILFWALDRRQWRLLLGGAGALALSLGIAMAFNPHVLTQFRANASSPPLVNVTPTIGALLRVIFGIEHTWLQYVPCVFGLLWLLVYYVMRRERWDWADEVPILLIASLLTNAYCWFHDYVLLLPAIIQAAVWCVRDLETRIAWRAALAYAAINGLALCLNLRDFTFEWFAWYPPAVLVGYLLLKHQARAVGARETADTLAKPGALAAE
jgi:hypothetical protein